MAKINLPLHVFTGVEVGSKCNIHHKIGFQASSADAGGTFTSGTILVEVSNDDINWIEAAEIELTGDADTGVFIIDASWEVARVSCTDFNAIGLTPTITINTGG